MRDRIQAEQSFRGYTRNQKPKTPTAALGTNTGVVDHPRRGDNWVYARLHGDPNQIVVAKEEGAVSHTADLQVELEYVHRVAHSYYRVVGLASGAFYSSNPWTSVGPHHTTHERQDGNTGGTDPVDVYARMVVPLRARAQTVPDLTVAVAAGYNPLTGNYFAGGNSAAVVVPAGAAQARYDLLYLGSDDALHWVTGAVSVGVTPTRPAVPVPSVPLAFIYLAVGQTTIEEHDVHMDPGILRSSVGGSASVDAKYVVLETNATLSQERVLTPGIGLISTDNGANSTVVLDGSPFSNDPFATSVSEDGYTGSYPNPEKRTRPLTSVALGGTTYQAITFWDKNGYLVIGKRVLDGAWTLYTYDGSGGLPTISIGTADNHNYSVVGLDPNGFVHVCYDMHNDPLNYRKSDAAINAWAGGLTAELAMLGVNENDVAYPAFVNDPAGSLYFLFRSGGAATGKHYFYKYNHAATTWAATTGSGAGGVIIDGTGVVPTRGDYPFDPTFDSDFAAGGYFHIAWTWRINDGTSVDHDPAYMKWDGTNWTKSGGAAQTIPATPANCETIETATVVGTISTYSDSNHYPHVVYAKTGADSYRHLYHAWYNGASWVVRQITFTASPASGVTDGTAGLQLTPHILIDRSTNVAYVFYLDSADSEGILAQKSGANDFTTWTRLIVYPQNTGWWKVTSDVSEWERDTLVYFAISYWDGGATSAYSQLPVRIFRWNPALDGPHGGSGMVPAHVHTTAVNTGGAIDHANLTNVTANQHHNQNHALDGATHTLAGSTAGYVLTATSATTFAFQANAGGSGELLMQDGVSSPPVPIETEDGTDWLYEG